MGLEPEMEWILNSSQKVTTPNMDLELDLDLELTSPHDLRVRHRWEPVPDLELTPPISSGWTEMGLGLEPEVTP